MCFIRGHIRAGLISHVRRVHNNSYKQHISQKLKAKLTKHSGCASGSVILQKIGSPPDTSPSLVLQTPNQCYMFNCSEDNNRTSLSYGIDTGEVTQIFLTQKNWSTIGGVPAILHRTSFATGAPPNFHGPKDIFKSLRRISYLSSLGAAYTQTIRPDIINKTGSFEDTDVRIDTIPIASRKQAENDIFSYLCRLKALSGHGLGPDARYPDREEVNFLSKI